jgi:hypothetical protein
MKTAERQIGSLKLTHHFGWNCFFILGEQLILQLSVTHSINSPAVAPVSGAAALAAGDKFCGKTCPVGGICSVGGTTIVLGLSSSNRLEFTHPGRTRKSVAANSCFMRLNNSENT